jgi:hypothetical protein
VREQSFASLENENWQDNVRRMRPSGVKEHNFHVCLEDCCLLRVDIECSGRHLFQRNFLSPFCK